MHCWVSRIYSLSIQKSWGCISTPLLKNCVNALVMMIDLFEKRCINFSSWWFSLVLRRYFYGFLVSHKMYKCEQMVLIFHCSQLRNFGWFVMLFSLNRVKIYLNQLLIKFYPIIAMYDMWLEFYLKDIYIFLYEAYFLFSYRYDSSYCKQQLSSSKHMQLLS